MFRQRRRTAVQQVMDTKKKRAEAQQINTELNFQFQSAGKAGLMGMIAESTPDFDIQPSQDMDFLLDEL